MRYRFLAPFRVLATRTGLLALCILSGVVAEMYVLAVHAPLRVQAMGRHRSPLPEFGTGLPVRQTFRATADGLDHIDVMFAATGVASGSIAWVLLEQSDETWRLRVAGHYRFEVGAGTFWQTIAFPSLRDSAGQAYALEMRLIGATVAKPSYRIAPVLTFDRDFPDGYVSLDGWPRPGDLVFRAVARGDTLAGRFAMAVLPGRRRPFDRMAAWWVFVAIVDVLVAAVTAGVVRSLRASPPPSAARS
jgi:hypothetical protein